MTRSGLKPSAGFSAFVLLLSVTARAQTWQVGPSRAYKKPSEVAGLVGDGDIVEIDAGVYKDVCIWYDDNLTLSGVGGKAHLDADGLAVAEGKAIWVIKGDNTTVERVEFSGASCVDKNGAGIRQEGADLTVRYCYFHDNEDGILGGGGASSDVLVEFSEFDHNGYGDGQSHNMYISAVGSFTLRYSYTHRARVGHEIKSRAATNYILYNRISNEDGSASRCIDLPNAGTAYVIGNVIQQGAASQNSNVFGFGMEGGTGTAYTVNNTFVNERSSVIFVGLASGCAGVLKNNIFYGGNTIVSGSGSYSGEYNYIPSGASGAGNLTNSVVGGNVDFVDASVHDYHLTSASVCIDAGVSPGTGAGYDLTPDEQYVHPAGQEPRASDGKIDIGAYEFGSTSPTNERPLVEAGTDQTVLAVTLPASADLDGTATDDGLPGPLVTIWMSLSGPGTVTFADDSAVDTTATFPAEGVYLLRLTADDGGLQASDEVTISVCADTDDDGLPDWWEELYFDSPADCDPSDDPDGDGWDNLREYEEGTDPTNPDTDGDGLPDAEDPTPLDPPPPFRGGCGSAAAIAALFLLLAARRGSLCGGGRAIRATLFRAGP